MGEVDGLNVPTRQATRPPSIPTSNNGPRNSGCVHPNAAAPMQSSNRIPVLLITPCKLIGSLPAQAGESALSRFNNGFDVSMLPSLLGPFAYHCNPLSCTKRKADHAPADPNSGK